MKIGFITNTDKDVDFSYTGEMIKCVIENGCVPVVCQQGSKNIPGAVFKTKEEMYNQVSFVVVLGGDGTILRVARTAAKYNTPILGINLGTLGYLTDVDKNQGKTAIEMVINNAYSIEERMMLEAYVEGSEEKYIGLNEVTVSNAGFARMMCFSLEINDDFINSYRADGIIVSTPTGSTAYNLSAGGPIIKPDNKLMAITTVCAHNLFARPFVVSEKDVVKIKIESDRKQTIFSIDGQNEINIEKGCKIIIKRSEYVTKIIRTTGMGFYDILRLKMLNNS